MKSELVIRISLDGTGGMSFEVTAQEDGSMWLHAHEHYPFAPSAAAARRAVDKVVSTWLEPGLFDDPESIYVDLAEL